MSSKYPPLTHKEVIKGLRSLGFEPRTQKGSHEQWVKETSEGRLKVTVDAPKAPFSQRLIGYMAAQAGMSKKAFYKACGR